MVSNLWKKSTRGGKFPFDLILFYHKNVVLSTIFGKAAGEILNKVHISPPFCASMIGIFSVFSYPKRKKLL
jgi:hypothetical protein